jgi:hypothetical protein
MGDHRRKAIAAGLATTILAGCASDPVTAARLQGDVGPTFRNMYVLQQHLLGDEGLPTRADVSLAACTKGAPGSPQRGPGDDWVCVVHWPAPSGLIDSLAYDVRVQPGGCYTAQGPAGAVGQQTLHAADGTEKPNPLYEFDGCIPR